jgi:hypothetical protein
MTPVVSPHFLLTLLLFAYLGVVPATHAQSGQPIPNATPVAIDFDGFEGAGFAPDPAAGQLDSDVFAVEGLSDGDLDFGGTATDDDFARGANEGGVTTGGIYAGVPSDADAPWLFVQPGGSDFTDGALVVRYVNTSGQTITDLDVAYDIKVFNDQERANSWDFSYSTDDVDYVDVPDLDYTSPEAADAEPTWVSVARNTMITGLSVPDGGNIYLLFASDDVAGSGGRDEIGVDNIVVSATLEAPSATVRFGEDAGTVIEGDPEGSVYDLLVELVNADDDFVTVSISTDCSSDDVMSSPLQLTLSPSNPSDFFTLEAADDEVEEDTKDCVYQLAIDSQDGNVEVGSPDTFTLTILDDDAPPVPNNTLVISEFMADPEGSATDASGEWVEVFNNTNEVIDLNGYFLASGSSRHEITSSVPVPVPAGGFAVLCRNADGEANGGITCDYAYTGVALNNSGSDDIVLLDPLDNVLDEVVYGSAWVSTGISTVYLGSPNGDNSILDNWAESIAREEGFDDATPLGDDGSPGANGVHGNLASPFGFEIANYCYTATSGFWDDPAIWLDCGGSTPGSDDAAVILSSSSPGVIADGDPVAVGVLVVEAGGSLLMEVPAAAEVVTVAGSLEISGEGSLLVGTDLSVSGEEGDGLATNDAVTLGFGESSPATITNELGSISGSLTTEQPYSTVSGVSGAGSFRGISPPLAGVTFDQLNDDFQTQGAEGSDFPDGQPTLYRFDAPTQRFIPITDYDAEFDPDSGYVYYMFDFEIEDGTSWDVTGTVRGEYELALHYSGDEDPSNDYNWVPQPFAGPLDFKEFYLASDEVAPGALNATLWVLDPATERFRTYNAESGIGASPSDDGSEPDTDGAGRYVAPFQSFVVQTAGAEATLFYDYDLKDTAPSPLFVGRRDGSPGDEVASHVRLQLDGEADGLGPAQTYLVFHPGSEEGYDAADAGMLYPLASRFATLVLMDPDGRELAMDARGADLVTERFRARVVATEPGTYTLTWPTLHEIPEGWSLTLLDTETGAEVDLRDQSRYVFEVGGATAQRRGETLGALHPARLDDDARFVIDVSSITTAGEGTGSVPADFALNETYPNPLSTSATVRYALPRAADVRLTVYDVLGRTVATLADGAHEAGHHTATLSGAGLADGVYFIRMTADGFAATRKVVVLD